MLACALLFHLICSLASAAVLWMPETFDPSDDRIVSNAVIPRTTAASCPGNPSLNQCSGVAFPSNFCCSPTTQCIALNTSTSSIQAAICCPIGSDCSLIVPVSCDQSMQNATLTPSSSLHAQPTQELEQCGTQCCPMGYQCQDGQCSLIKGGAVANTGSATIATSSMTPTTVASPTSSSTTASTTAPTSTAVGSTLEDPGDGSGTNSTHFSGGAFIAGFIPGILLGVFLTALLLFLLCRRQKNRHTNNSSDHSWPHTHHSEKHDTLTDLGTLSRRPTLHNRSISEPTAHPYTTHRTDFLRTTPPRIPELDRMSGYVVTASGPHPHTPSPPRSSRTPKAAAKALFTRSPFLNNPSPATPPTTHPPLPAHLKRGTLSFSISPVRGLKKQKSMHSLRRQMTDASHSTRREFSRQGSEETIRVMLPQQAYPTPDQRPFSRIREEGEAQGKNAYRPHDSTSSSTYGAQTVEMPLPPPTAQTYASSSRYPTMMEYTPTRIGGGGGSAVQLGTPYTPSAGRVTDVLVDEGGGGLRVVREGVETQRRDTTFSAMMERAGFRKSELIGGSVHHRR